LKQVYETICRPRVSEPVFQYKGVCGREGNAPSVLDIGTRWDFLSLYPRWSDLCCLQNKTVVYPKKWQGKYFHCAGHECLCRVEV